MRRLLKAATAALFVLLVAAQFVRPSKTNPPIDAARVVGAHVSLTPQVEVILERSCKDCHSNRTEWPWYSQVAPASWFVIDHVNHGRKHLNFSEWSRYEGDEARHLLKNVCRTAENGTMPLRSYTLLHPDAKLSPADVRALCDWARGADIDA